MKRGRSLKRNFSSVCIECGEEFTIFAERAHRVCPSCKGERFKRQRREAKRRWVKRASSPVSPESSLKAISLHKLQSLGTFPDGGSFASTVNAIIKGSIILKI